MVIVAGWFHWFGIRIKYSWRLHISSKLKTENRWPMWTECCVFVPHIERNMTQFSYIDCGKKPGPPPSLSLFHLLTASKVKIYIRYLERATHSSFHSFFVLSFLLLLLLSCFVLWSILFPLSQTVFDPIHWAHNILQFLNSIDQFIYYWLIEWM